MKGKRVLGVVLALALVISLLLSAIAYAAPPDGAGKPDKHKPVPATEVEIVQKVSDRGPGKAGSGEQVRARKPAKPPTQAATGDLGNYPVTGAKYAIVVGISDYPGTANDLVYADDDANEMAEALTSIYGYSNVTLLLDLDATREAILTAIEDIDDVAQADDEVVFFFSGHGAKGRAADGDKEAIDEAIVAHDGSNLVPIWDGELRGAFSEFATSRIVFVFDTCLAGGMTDLKASGRVIAMATTETGYAYESVAWGNGEFTYYFVDKGMLQGLADKYDHLADVPDVTVEEAWDYAKANCTSDRPTISDSFENDLLL